MLAFYKLACSHSNGIKTIVTQNREKLLLKHLLLCNDDECKQTNFGKNLIDDHWKVYGKISHESTKMNLKI